LIGQPDEGGFGVPQRPSYSFINDLIQLDEDTILVVDTGNHCIRKVRRSTGMAEIYAGRCRSFGAFEGTVNANEANFDSPTRAIYVKPQNLLYYLIYFPEPRIVQHNMTSGGRFVH
jgi:hypothetical protein